MVHSIMWQKNKCEMPCELHIWKNKGYVSFDFLTLMSKALFMRFATKSIA